MPNIQKRLISLGDKEDKLNKSPKFFNAVHTNGLKTQRDSWCYNFSAIEVGTNMAQTISFYNTQRELYSSIEYNKPTVEDFVDDDETKISWTRALRYDLGNNKQGIYNKDKIIEAIYRPYNKQNVYCDRQFNELLGIQIKAFPDKKINNLVISVSGVGGNKGFSCLITIYICESNTYSVIYQQLANK